MGPHVKLSVTSNEMWLNSNFLWHMRNVSPLTKMNKKILDKMSDKIDEILEKLRLLKLLFNQKFAYFPSFIK